MRFLSSPCLFIQNIQHFMIFYLFIYLLIFCALREICDSDYFLDTYFVILPRIHLVQNHEQQSVIW